MLDDVAALQVLGLEAVLPARGRAAFVRRRATQLLAAIHPDAQPPAMKEAAEHLFRLVTEARDVLLTPPPRKANKPSVKPDDGPVNHPTVGSTVLGVGFELLTVFLDAKAKAKRGRP